MTEHVADDADMLGCFLGDAGRGDMAKAVRSACVVELATHHFRKSFLEAVVGQGPPVAADPEGIMAVPGEQDQPVMIDVAPEPPGDGAVERNAPILAVFHAEGREVQGEAVLGFFDLLAQIKPNEGAQPNRDADQHADTHGLPDGDGMSDRILG